MSLVLQLVGWPREEFRYAWEEVQRRCPEWIGFRGERVTPDPKFQTFVDQMDDSF